MPQHDLTKWNPDEGSRFGVSIEIEIGLEPGDNEQSHDDRDYGLNPRGPLDAAWEKARDDVLGNSLKDLIFDYGIDFGASLTLSVHDFKHRPKHYGRAYLSQRYWWNGSAWVESGK